MQPHDNQQSIDRSYQTSDYQALFENSPIALWEYDITAVYTQIQNLHESSVTDFAAYFHDHPEEIKRCIRGLRAVNVNSVAIELFDAENKEELLNNPVRLLLED